MRGMVAVAFALAGCGDVFDLEKVGPPADARPDADVSVCLEDHFEVGIDPMWLLWGMPGVQPSASNGHLVLAIGDTPPADPHLYGGLYTTPHDFTGISAELQIISPPAGQAEVIMQFTWDDSHTYLVGVSEGVLNIAKKDSGVVTEAMTNYVLKQHQFQRMRHDVEANEMVFEARGSRQDPWIELKRITATVSLAGASFEVYAGSYAANTATDAIVDDVVLLGSCPLF